MAIPTKPTSNKFDTTGIQRINPGLTYAQPQADQSGKYYNSLGAFANIAESAVVNATRVDQALVEAEARNVAKDMSHEFDVYDDIFETQTNIKNTVSKLQSAETEEEKSSYRAELNDYAEQLGKLQSQGIPDPFEFKMRMNAKAADIYHRNPAYAAEISAEMNKIFNIHGVNDKLTAIQSGIDAQNKQAERIRNIKIDYLMKERKVDITGMDFDEIDSTFETEIREQRLALEANKTGELSIALDDEQRWQYYNGIVEEGGLDYLTNITLKDARLKLQLISESGLDAREQERLRQEVIGELRRAVNSHATRLPQETRFSNWKSSVDGLIDKLDTDSKGVITGATDAGILKSSREQLEEMTRIAQILEGKGPADMEYGLKLAQIYEALRKADPQASLPITKEIADLLIQYSTGGNSKLPSDHPLVNQLRNNLKPRVKAVKEMSDINADLINRTGELDKYSQSHYDNFWHLTQMHNPQSELRFKEGMDIIKSFNGMNEVTWNWLMENSVTFASDANQELQVQKWLLNEYMYGDNGAIAPMINENRWLGVNVLDTGLIQYRGSDAYINNLLNKVNQYTMFYARVNGMTRKQAVDTLMKEDQNFLYYLLPENVNKLGKLKREQTWSVK